MVDITIRKNTEAPITCVKKQKTKRPGFPFVCTRGSNTSLKKKSWIKFLKTERGIAQMPLSPFFVENT